MIDTNSDNLKIIYTQLCDSYHKVDDFRSKLLGFLPLASGATLLGILNVDKNDQVEVAPYFCEIGLFGMLITLGLLIYELKGIQKCTGFIYYGKLIEEKMLGGLASPLIGQFTSLWKKEKLWWGATEPVASGVVYATVMTVWVYVAFLKKTEVGNKTAYSGTIGPAVFCWFVVFGGVLLFWIFCAKPLASAKNETLKN